jgi:hypothetical protein
MAERARLTEIDDPPHDSLPHLHEHADRPPSAEPHEHAHPWLPGDPWQHQHLHRHVYDMPALEPEEDGAHDG